MARALTLMLLTFLVVGHAMDPIRKTKQGKVRGRKVTLLDTDLEVYTGIPYAEAPVGELRFKPPVPKSSWKGIHETTREGVACIQMDRPIALTEVAAYSEDCLHVNIWTPALEKGEKVPVLVWIHGGGFTFGSASFVNSNGTYLAALTGYVVVAMNYRLGILGFLNADSPEAPGNMGLLDQHLALQWIHENIEYFGGNPSLVTLFGISSGGQSVLTHTLSPMSDGLFKRAIMISGAMHTSDFFDTTHESTRKGNEISKIVGCNVGGADLISHPEEVLDCLRLKSAYELSLTASELVAPILSPFLPTYHDEFLPKPPAMLVDRGFFNEVDILSGITSDEGSIMITVPPSPDLLEESLENFDEDSLTRRLNKVIAPWLKDDIPDMLENYRNRAISGDMQSLRRAYIDYLSDRAFKCLAQFFAEKGSERGNAVYSFIFAHKSNKSPLPRWMGIPHGGNVDYFFGGPFANPEAYTPEDQVMSEHTIQMMASFAKDGVPVLPNIDGWPKYAKDTPLSIWMSSNNFTHVHGYRKTECEQWRKYF